MRVAFSTGVTLTTVSGTGGWNGRLSTTRESPRLVSMPTAAPAIDSICLISSGVRGFGPASSIMAAVMRLMAPAGWFMCLTVRFTAYVALSDSEDGPESVAVAGGVGLATAVVVLGTLLAVP